MIEPASGAGGGGGPRYRQLAEHIRQQILAGQLQPGDRVPSARQLMREAGIALATATRVLETLRRQGLVAPVVGRGTMVVAQPEAPASPPGPPASLPSAAPAERQPASAAAHQRPARTGAAAGTTAGAADRGRAGPAERGPVGPTERGQSGATERGPVGPTERGRVGATEQGRVGAAVEGQGELRLERIVGTAIAIADAEGLGALSMRRLATALEAAAMSLYRHVASKDELVLLMADAVLAEDPFPSRPPAGWRARLALVAWRQWSIYRRHPWLAHVLSITRPQLLPNGVAHTEWMLRSLSGLGLEPTVMLHMAVCLVNYVRGTAVNFETQVQDELATGLSDDQWLAEQDAAFRRLFATGRYPTLAGMVTSPGVELDLDSLFGFGLERLLDGYVLLVQQAGPLVEPG